MKIGDRVRVISLKCYGILKSIDVKTATVEITDPNIIAIARPKERIATTNSDIDPESMMYFTFANDVEPVLSGKPEPDWKDIWDSNT
jgi:hypothetical protein